jgi:hypothetical protein
MHQKIGELLRVLYNKQSWHIAFYQTGWLSTNASDMDVVALSSNAEIYLQFLTHAMTFATSFSLPLF